MRENLCKPILKKRGKKEKKTKR